MRFNSQLCWSEDNAGREFIYLELTPNKTDAKLLVRPKQKLSPYIKVRKKESPLEIEDGLFEKISYLVHCPSQNKNSLILEKLGILE